MPSETRSPRALTRLYDKHIDRLVPRKHLIPAICLPLLNTLIYFGADLILGDVERSTVALPWDAKIPLIPAWILVYFGCYLSWAWGYIIAARQDTASFYGFFTRVFFGLLTAFLVFTLFPLEIARPEVTGTGIFADGVRLLYRIDTPYNLLPSLHCFYNWMIFVQIRGRKEYHIVLRIFTFLLAIAVFLSTLFLRQHYILDIVAAVFLVEISALLLKTPLPRFFERVFTRVNQFIFTKKTPSK